MMIVAGVIGKFGALFVSIPDPIVGGVFMVMFGMIAAVGISNLQFADMNSGRNLFIVGFSIVFGLGLPYYMNNHPNAINTGTSAKKNSGRTSGRLGCWTCNSKAQSSSHALSTCWTTLVNRKLAYHRTELGLMKSQDARPLQKKNVYYQPCSMLDQKKNQSESIKSINYCQKYNFKDRTNIRPANTVLHQVYY